MPTILIVDDDDAIRGVLYDLLTEKYECHTASMAEEALQYLEFEDYDVILTDIEMPGLDGVAVLKRVQLRDSSTPVIVISGKADDEEAKNLINLGAFAYIQKPFELREIDDAVERAIKAGNSET
jgi:DNA-binding NtrC family response regulator